jgi:hypothetical protein
MGCREGVERGVGDAEFLATNGYIDNQVEVCEAGQEQTEDPAAIRRRKLDHHAPTKGTAPMDVFRRCQACRPGAPPPHTRCHEGGGAPSRVNQIHK